MQGFLESLDPVILQGSNDGKAGSGDTHVHYECLFFFQPSCYFKQSFGSADAVFIDPEYGVVSKSILMMVTVGWVASVSAVMVDPSILDMGAATSRAKNEESATK